MVLEQAVLPALQDGKIYVQGLTQKKPAIPGILVYVLLSRLDRQHPDTVPPRSFLVREH